MHFIVYVLETWDQFLPILLIKHEHNNYFKLNSTMVEEGVKEPDQDECFNLLSLDEWELVVFWDEGIHFMKELYQDATLTLSCVFGY